MSHPCLKAGVFWKMIKEIAVDVEKLKENP